MTNKHPSLFSPFMLTEKIKLRNRIVMAPMTTWSANPDGTISEQELEFYKRRSQNVGLVITGCTYVTPSGIGFTHEFAAYDDRFINSLEKLAAAAKSGGLRLFCRFSTPVIKPSRSLCQITMLLVPAHQA